MSHLDYRLAATDPVAIVLAWLKAHPRVLEAAGNDGASGEVEGPWPHVRVAPADSGTVGGLLDSVRGDVVIEVYGDPAGASPSQLRAIGTTCLLAAKELTEREHVPGQAVVSMAAPTTRLAPQKLKNGQTRWSATVSITAKPG